MNFGSRRVRMYPSIVKKMKFILANGVHVGLTGSDRNNGLQVTDVFNARHGTVSRDQNGFVRFVPEANYFGTDAGFEYRVMAPTGQTSTTFVDINLQNVNDAPAATVDQHLRHTYGYTSFAFEWEESVGFRVTPTEPQYMPYNGYDYQTNTDGWHNTPLSTEDVDGEHNGSLVVTDTDNNSGFTYQVVGQPQYGAATVDANGSWHYINWAAPNEPGEHWSQTNASDSGPGEPYDSTGHNGLADAFLLKVTDPGGASSTVQIDVHHVGEYYPNYGTGGGGKKPIAIDLDGDGFQFTDIDDSNVFVDINKDGWRHRMAWLNGSDGLLAYDANGNGKVDSAKEFRPLVEKAAQGSNFQLSLSGDAFGPSDHSSFYAKGRPVLMFFTGLRGNVNTAMNGHW